MYVYCIHAYSSTDPPALLLPGLHIHGHRLPRRRALRRRRRALGGRRRRRHGVGVDGVAIGADLDDDSLRLEEAGLGDRISVWCCTVLGERGRVAWLVCV